MEEILSTKEGLVVIFNNFFEKQPSRKTAWETVRVGY